MKNFLTKTIPFVVIALVATSSVAAERRYDRNRQQKMEQGHEIRGNQLMPAYNAPARYDVQGSWDFYFQGDFVYMQALEENLTYAVSSSDSQANNSNPPLDGKIYTPDFDWHPGVKVGLGAYTDYDDWGVFLEWMHLVSKNNTNTSAPTGGCLWMPQSVSGGTAQTALEARNTYSMSFNSIDFNLDRPYYVGKKLVFDTFFGLRGAWIRQNFDTQYNNVVDGSGTTQRGTTQVLSSYNNWAVGPRVGINTSWMLGYGCRLFGNAAGSLLYTDFDVAKTVANSSQAGALTGRNSNQFLFQVNQDDNKGVRPNMDIALGFAWGTYFANSTWHVDLVFGYEFHQWWSQNANLVAADDLEKGTLVSGGDLSIHGGTFTLRFDL